MVYSTGPEHLEESDEAPVLIDLNRFNEIARRGVQIQDENQTRHETSRSRYQ